MSPYAERTEVTSDKSRAEIERTLQRYGAQAFSYGWDQGRAVIQFRTESRFVRFVLPLPDRDDHRFTQYKQGASTFLRTESNAEKLYEQAVRQKWRALALVIKAKLEAVEAGITTFEDEFLAHTVLPNGDTVGEWMAPQVEEAYRIGAMPSVLPALGAGRG